MKSEFYRLIYIFMSSIVLSLNLKDFIKIKKWNKNNNNNNNIVINKQTKLGSKSKSFSELFFNSFSACSSICVPAVFILHKEIAVGVFNGFWREFNTNVGGLDGSNIWDVTF